MKGVLVALVSLVLAGASVADASADYMRNAGIEARAAGVRGTPVQVFCSTDNTEWQRDFGTRLAAAFFDLQYVALSSVECAALQTNIPTDRNYTRSIYIFLHELLHTAGLRDEGETECWTLFLLRYELRHNFGFSAGDAQAAWLDAWVAHRTLAPAYLGTCSADENNGLDLVSPANGLR